MALLTQLIRKNKKFVWGEEQDRSFLEVKTKLTSAPVLIVPWGLKDLPFIMMCQNWDWDMC